MEARCQVCGELHRASEGARRVRTVHFRCSSCDTLHIITASGIERVSLTKPPAKIAPEVIASAEPRPPAVLDALTRTMSGEHAPGAHASRPSALPPPPLPPPGLSPRARGATMNGALPPPAPPPLRASSPTPIPAPPPQRVSSPTPIPAPRPLRVSSPTPIPAPMPPPVAAAPPRAARSSAPELHAFDPFAVAPAAAAPVEEPIDEPSDEVTRRWSGDHDDLDVLRMLTTRRRRARVVGGLVAVALVGVIGACVAFGVHFDGASPDAAPVASRDAPSKGAALAETPRATRETRPGTEAIAPSTTDAERAPVREIELADAPAPIPGAAATRAPARAPAEPAPAPREPSASASAEPGHADESGEASAKAEPGAAEPSGKAEPKGAEPDPGTPAAEQAPAGSPAAIADAMTGANAPSPLAEAPPPDASALRASMAVASGAAASCAQPDGPKGTGHVSVTFAPSGRVTQAVVEAGPFAGTPVGACVARAFRGASVRPFGGPYLKVHGTFTIR